MRRGQTLPTLWLISDARNDAVLDRAIARLPRGGGVVFRHYHLGPEARRARFAQVRRLARQRGGVVVLADRAALARRWRADGIYGAPHAPRGAGGLLRIATVHGMRELAAAQRAGADLVFISPVHATRSHPGAVPLGPVRARRLAAWVQVPVVMLGGLDARRGAAMAPHGWAAIDGLSHPARRDTHRLPRLH